MSPAIAQSHVLSARQTKTLDAYNRALSDFKSILAERRRQIDSHQELPNLPGQALYLARIEMMSSYKDLTDGLPSRIGRPNKFKIPPQYFDADNEPLVDEYRALFDIMEAPPANAQKSASPFKDVVNLGTAIARAKGWMWPMRQWRANQPRTVLCRDERHQNAAMRAPIATRAVSRHPRPRIETAGGNGRPSKSGSQPSTRN
jgi:hypothetical protein